MLNELPIDLLATIVDYITYHDKLTFYSTSKQIRQLSKDSRFWSIIYWSKFLCFNRSLLANSFITKTLHRISKKRDKHPESLGLYK